MITAFPGWTVNDVLDTDDATLMDMMTVQAENKKTQKKKQKKEVMPMHEFLKTVKGG